MPATVRADAGGEGILRSLTCHSLQMCRRGEQAPSSGVRMCARAFRGDDIQVVKNELEVGE